MGPHPVKSLTSGQVFLACFSQSIIQFTYTKMRSNNCCGQYRTEMRPNSPGVRPYELVDLSGRHKNVIHYFATRQRSRKKTIFNPSSVHKFQLREVVRSLIDFQSIQAKQMKRSPDRFDTKNHDNKNTYHDNHRKMWKSHFTSIAAPQNVSLIVQIEKVRSTCFYKAASDYFLAEEIDCSVVEFFFPFIIVLIVNTIFTEQISRHVHFKSIMQRGLLVTRIY